MSFTLTKLHFPSCKDENKPNFLKNEQDSKPKRLGRHTITYP